MKQTKKVSFRVAPPVKEFLEAAADCSNVTLANFIRGSLSYLLTGDQGHLPEFFLEAQEPIALWPLDNATEYKRFMDELSAE